MTVHIKQKSTDNNHGARCDLKRPISQGQMEGGKSYKVITDFRGIRKVQGDFYHQ